jgi:hypothetical protein
VLSYDFGVIDVKVCATPISFHHVAIAAATIPTTNELCVIQLVLQPFTVTGAPSI